MATSRSRSALPGQSPSSPFWGRSLQNFPGGRSVFGACLVAGSVMIHPSQAQEPVGSPVPGSAADRPAIPITRSLRGFEVLRQNCLSEIGRRDVTLFGNGTVRLRELPGDGMVLLELTPDEVDAIYARIRLLDLSEVDSRATVEGSWVDRCEIVLQLPEQPEAIRYPYGRLDATPLSLSALVQLVEELVARADELDRQRRAPSGLPAGYRPRAGDRLLHSNGHVFEVVALTSDRRGVELVGLDQPISVYVAIDSLRAEFVGFAPR